MQYTNRLQNRARRCTGIDDFTIRARQQIYAVHGIGRLLFGRGLQHRRYERGNRYIHRQGVAGLLDKVTFIGR